MANFKEHALASTGTAALTYLVMCHYYHREPTFGEGAVCAGIGLASGVAPDWFEPSLHPHHRQFCHSLTAGAFLLRGGATICGDSNQQWTEFSKIMLACAIVGYLTHLVLDGCTARGLPLLGF